MGFTGFFQAASLSPDWQGYHRLAQEMERRRLTNLQAQTILWYSRGLGPTQIGRLVDSERSNVCKALSVGVRHLVGPHKPVLTALRRKWGVAVFHCFKNRRGGCSNQPLIFDRAGNLVSLRAKVLLPEDFESWRETPTDQFLDAEAFVPAGTAERYIEDLDLFATLLDAILKGREPEAELERLIPSELAADPLVFALTG